MDRTINSIDVDPKAAQDSIPLAETVALEAYERLYAESTKPLQVPVLKIGEIRDEKGDVLLSSLPGNDKLTRLYMEGRKSIGKIYGDDNSVGTGFFIDKDGLFATDFHVVEFDSDKVIDVRTDDGKLHQATMVASDQNNDLALFKVEKLDKNEEFHAVKLAPFDASVAGQEFVSCGFGVDDELHCSPGIYDSSIQQKDIKLKDTAPYLDPERKLAHLKQNTEHGDSGGLEFASDGTVRLLVDMTDGKRHTLATPAQYLIALRDQYLKTS